MFGIVIFLVFSGLFSSSNTSSIEDNKYQSFFKVFGLGGASSLDDWGKSVVETNSGDIVVSGYTYNSNNVGFYDIFVFKFSPKYGKVEWCKVFGGLNDDRGVDIRSTEDDGIIFVGFSYDLLPGMSKCAMLAGKLNSGGSMEWAKAVGGMDWDVGWTITTTRDGGFVAAGETSNSAVDSSGDFLFVYFNSTGGVNWIKTFGFSQADVISKIRETSDYGFIATGYMKSVNTVLMKMDSNGNVEWFNRIIISGDSDGEGKDVVETRDGSFVITGWADILDFDRQAIIMKFSSVGILIWSKTIGGDNVYSYNEVGEGIIETKEGNLIMVGSERMSSPTTHAFIVELFGNGSLKVAKQIDGFYSKAYGIIETEEGALIVGIMTLSTLPSTEVYTFLSFYNSSYDLPSIYPDDCSRTLWGYAPAEMIFTDAESITYVYNDSIIVTNDLTHKFNLSEVTESDLNFTDVTEDVFMTTFCEKCKPEYVSEVFGDNCNVTSCNGEWNNATNGLCSDHGNCYFHDICECFPNYYGVDCSITSCYGIFNNDTDQDSSRICSGHGTCTWKDVCECDDFYFHSQDTEILDCSNFTCDRQWWGSEFVCSGHGNCTAHDTCLCEEFYNEYDQDTDFCEIWECNNVRNDNDLVCQGHGHCESKDECVCHEKYVGENCDYTCFNVSYKNSEEVCNGYGTCASVDLCSCFAGYQHSSYESPCDTWGCFGNMKDEESSVCSGKGECVSPNICICKNNFEGWYCEGWSCGVDHKLPSTCNGHGKCKSPSKCKCNRGYSGRLCDTNDLLLTVMTPVLSSAGLIFVLFMSLFFCCVLCAGCICCMVLCVSVGYIGALFFRNRVQKYSLRKFGKLKNVDLILREQEMEEDVSVAHLRINKSLFEIDYDDIKMLSILGEGGSNSVVYKSKWNGQIVAFKVFKTTSVCQNQESFDEFESEVEILSSISHPNILQFFGCSLKAPRVGILMEFCSKGDLDMYVKQYRMMNGGKGVEFTMKCKFLIMIIGAMTYLHSKKIIHRDLKLENVLVDKNDDCKLMDFGLSKIVDRMSKVKTKRIGTSYFMAPELILGKGDYDETIDCFAFGVLMFILLSEMFHPYGPNQTYGIEIRVANDPDFRPDVNNNDNFDPEKEIPSKHMDWLKGVCRRCWSHEKRMRPSFLELSEMFEKRFSSEEEEDPQKKSEKDSTSEKKKEKNDDDDEEEKMKRKKKKKKNVISFGNDEDEDEDEDEEVLRLRIEMGDMKSRNEILTRRVDELELVVKRLTKKVEV